MNIDIKKIKRVITRKEPIKKLKQLQIEQVLHKKSFIVSSRIFAEKYSGKDTQIIILKIANSLIKELVMNKEKTNCIRLYIGYHDEDIPSLKLTLNLSEATNNCSKLKKIIIKNYNINVSKDNLVKKIGISFEIKSTI